MRLGLRIAQKQIQTLKPTMQQLQYYRLLQQTNLELELDIQEEITQNPALEIEETRRCPNCGEMLLDSHPCTTCISRKNEDQDRESIQSEKIDIMEEIYSSSQGNYEASTYESIPDDELPDTFATVVRSVTLEEYLKHKLPIECCDFTDDELALAENLIDRIDAGPESDSSDDSSIDDTVKIHARVDNPGLIKSSDAELALEFDVPLNMLKKVRRRIAEIDANGSGLESAVEVLALQAELEEKLPAHDRIALAKIIRNHLSDISKELYPRVGKKVGIPAKRVKELIDYMKRSFHIHPRRNFEENVANAVTENPYVIADVRIREVDGKFTVEVLDSGLPQLKINSFYMESYKKLKVNPNAFNAEERKHIKEYFERAQFYIENLNSRRQTMLEITEEIIRCQEDFLRKGPQYLKNLTRKQVAETIGVHPSTVSRALASRFCWLPDNSIVSFNVFFDNATSPIEMIRQILRNETPDKVFSDEEIRDFLAEKGFDLSRRVITKYRKKGRIPPSGRRRRILAGLQNDGNGDLGHDIEDDLDDDLELDDSMDSDDTLESDDPDIDDIEACDEVECFETVDTAECNIPGAGGNIDRSTIVNDNPLNNQ